MSKCPPTALSKTSTASSKHSPALDRYGWSVNTDNAGSSLPTAPGIPAAMWSTKRPIRAEHLWDKMSMLISRVTLHMEVDVSSEGWDMAS